MAHSLAPFAPLRKGRDGHRGEGLAADATCALAGGGIIGAAAAFALAGRGAEIPLFDQFALRRDRGGSLRGKCSPVPGTLFAPVV